MTIDIKSSKSKASTETLNNLKQQFISDLSDPRPLSSQVFSYLSDHFSLSLEDLPTFFKEKAPTLEAFEVDLAFSPMFTPTLQDRSRYATILKEAHLDTQDVQTLIRDLTHTKLTLHLTTEQGDSLSWNMHEAMIDRYVSRMSLQKPLHTQVYDALTQWVPERDQSIVNVLGREAIWQDTQRRDILIQFLETFHHRNTFSVERVSHLTDFVRTYRPKVLEDLDRQIVSLIKSCEEDLEKVGERSYLDDQLKGQYAHQVEADHHEAAAIRKHYQHLIDLAQQLREDYRVLCQRSEAT